MEKITVICFKDSRFPLLPEVTLKYEDKFVVVNNVPKLGIFYDAGIEDGDIILEVNGQSFENISSEMVYKILSSIEGNVTMSMRKQGKTLDDDDSNEGKLRKENQLLKKKISKLNEQMGTFRTNQDAITNKIDEVKKYYNRLELEKDVRIKELENELHIANKQIEQLIEDNKVLATQAGNIKEEIEEKDSSNENNFTFQIDELYKTIEIKDEKIKEMESKFKAQEKNLKKEVEQTQLKYANLLKESDANCKEKESNPREDEDVLNCQQAKASWKDSLEERWKRQEERLDKFEKFAMELTEYLSYQNEKKEKPSHDSYEEFKYFSAKRFSFNPESEPRKRASRSPPSRSSEESFFNEESARKRRATKRNFIKDALNKDFKQNKISSFLDQYK